MRIAIVYDCLYPHTVGGAERWYADLARNLAVRHEVTYLTRRQWRDDAELDAPAGVRVVDVCPGGPLYTRSGRRSIGSPLRFGAGVLAHLLRHRHDYDVVHTCAFPYFSLLAARLACAGGGPAIVTDWFEVWSREYWTEYLGRAGGRAGALVQRLCARLTQQATVMSELHARRLESEGYRGSIVRAGGIYAGPSPNASAGVKEPLVVYVGRHFAHKGVGAIPAAVAAARERIPALRAVIFGDGPERARVQAEISRLGLEGVVSCPGFTSWEQIEADLRRATCLLLPSQREGYGLVIVEAAVHGTPSIVVRGPDNAATELISPGVNGLIAESAEPRTLAAAIDAVHRSIGDLAPRTQAWFRENAARLTIEASLAHLEAMYVRLAAPRSAAGAPAQAIRPPGEAVRGVALVGGRLERRPEVPL